MLSHFFKPLCYITLFFVLISNAYAGPKVAFKTSQGDFTVELYPEKAPVTVENFLQYVNDGFYSGTIFHRVINNFMIQGGGFDANMQQKETKTPIKNEAANGLKNQTGTIAMARTQAPNSATAQFFINLKDNDFLNHTGTHPSEMGYCVFGKVISGMDVVNKIAVIPTGFAGRHQDVPTETIKINSVTLISEDNTND